MISNDVRGAENISISQLITLALAKKVSALAAEDFIQKRAARASKQNSVRRARRAAHRRPAAGARVRPRAGLAHARGRAVATWL